MLIQWPTLTQAEARRLIGAAKRADNAATARASASQSDSDIAQALAAYTVWEDLQVFIVTGERPAPTQEATTHGY